MLRSQIHNVLKIIHVWKQYCCGHFPLLASESSGWSVTLLDASVIVTECSSREMQVTVGEENTCCKGIY